MAQELKAYNVVATADVNPDVVDRIGCTEWACYDKDEVDAVLAEKDKEIRKLKRALYKACANWAMAEAYSILHDVSTANRWVHTMNKCRAKAEESK